MLEGIQNLTCMVPVSAPLNASIFWKALSVILNPRFLVCLLSGWFFETLVSAIPFASTFWKSWSIILNLRLLLYLLSGSLFQWLGLLTLLYIFWLIHLFTLSWMRFSSSWMIYGVMLNALWSLSHLSLYFSSCTWWILFLYFYATFPGLLGTAAFAFFCFYLLLAVIAGAMMLGLRLVFITIHPMK